jgi:hypothetical protein
MSQVREGLPDHGVDPPFFLKERLRPSYRELTRARVVTEGLPKIHSNCDIHNDHDTMYVCRLFDW